MSAVVVSLAEKREEQDAKKLLKDLRQQADALERSNADIRLRLEPGLRSSVLLALAAVCRDAAPSRLARAREPLLELMALLLAEQHVQGDEPDPLRALAVAFGDARFCLDMPQLVAESLDTLSIAYEQLRREYGPGVFDS